MTIPVALAAPPAAPPLRQSVFLLAQFAALAAGATAFSLQESGLVDAGIGRANGSSRVQFPIRVDGRQVATLIFAFSEDSIPAEKLPLLGQMAAVIEAVQGLPHATASLAAQVASLDAELADIKIGERARGLLIDGAPAEDALETIIRHVKHVLERRPIGMMFEQLLPEMKDRVKERKLMMKAKGVLQRQRGMSEEQAYTYLRIRSRSTRKRLGEIAKELISESAAAR